MTYDQSDDRYKGLITAATQISQLTAFYYQKHFFGGSIFKMVKCKTKDENLTSRVIIEDKSIFLLLDLDQEDHRVMCDVNHEITHIDQISQQIEQKALNYDSFANLLLLSFMREGHAYGNQTEGPTLALLNEVEQKKIKPFGMIDKWRGKKHQPTIHIKTIENGRFTEPYLKALFQDKSNRYQSSDLMGYIMNGYRFSYSKLNPTQRQARIIEARKAIVETFMNDDDFTASYASNVICVYMMKDKSIRQSSSPISAALSYKDMTLQKMTGFLLNYEKPFLPEKDWTAVLGGASKNEIVKEIVSKNKHKDELTEVLSARNEHLILKM